MKWQEGSDSDQESNDASGISKKPQKRKRGKEHNISRDPSQSHDSSNGCLSLLKMKRFDGTLPYCLYYVIESFY